jgi:hypothetical protein
MTSEDFQMKGNIMHKTAFFTAALSLLLAGCTTTGTLQSVAPGAAISGTLTRGAIEPHRIEVAVDGRKYRGEWRTGEPTQAQRAATALPHQWHIGQVRSVLVADDGSMMECRWQTHGNSAEGTCKTSDREYPVILR